MCRQHVCTQLYKYATCIHVNTQLSFIGIQLMHVCLAAAEVLGIRAAQRRSTAARASHCSLGLVQL